jgi:DNA-binding FadR family transcriptional regulator
MKSNPAISFPRYVRWPTHLNVNLHTVRAAYRLLEGSNLISTRQGLGSVVLEYDPSATVATNTLPTNTFGIIVPIFKTHSIHLC